MLIKSLNLNSFSKSGVFVLVDHETKCFYITYSTNFKYVIGEVYELVTNGEVPANSEILELSSTTDMETLQLHYEFHRSQYLELGYNQISPKTRKALEYRVRVLVAPDLKSYDVQLVTKRGSKILTVGRFENKRLADQFVFDYYNEFNPCSYPVYAINSLTKELLSHKEEDGLYL